ncbi:glycosyltransferase family 92 protein [Cobetia marina]
MLRIFFIADNGSNDGTQEILAQEALVGDITWESWTPPVNAQIKWYEECLLRYRYQCKWMGFFDIDEFLIDSQNDNIISKLTALLEHDIVGGVAINWRIFGSAGFKRAQPGTVTSRFNMASRLSRIVNQHVKCIVKPQAISKVYVHAPKLKSGYCYVFF